MAFTIESARTMLENIQAKQPDKLFAAIFTIIRDGIDNVSASELPAVVTVLATEVRIKDLEAALEDLTTIAMGNGKRVSVKRAFLEFLKKYREAPGTTAAPTSDVSPIGSHGSSNDPPGASSASATSSEQDALDAQMDAAVKKANGGGSGGLSQEQVAHMMAKGVPAEVMAPVAPPVPPAPPTAPPASAADGKKKAPQQVAKS